MSEPSDPSRPHEVPVNRKRDPMESRLSACDMR